MVKYFFLTIFLVLINKFGIAQCLNSEQDYKDYYLKNIQTLDPIEGIYNVSIHSRTLFNGEPLHSPGEDIQTDYNGAVFKVGEIFQQCVISEDIEQSFLDRSFNTTAANGIYILNGIDENSISFKTPAVLTANVFLNYSEEWSAQSVKNEIKEIMKQGHYNYNDDALVKEQAEHYRIITDFKMIKLFPTEKDYTKSQPSSGTGFAITNNGFLVTNHHVIDGAQTITVRGINSDFTKKYSAKVIIEDKTNDIAIIKIDDPTFTGLGTIPYAIKNTQDDVGSSIFVLGYPLRATMGDEIKLTNGIISSKSGFQGDITAYQISAPIQPGNSGGPLFDDKGNLIGIVNAKHLDAENVSYAIKILYLGSLVESGNEKIQLTMVNSLLGKSLSDQVKIIKKFVYIIEVN